MGKVLPSKTLAARIETIRHENPALTVEMAYDRIKKEDPKLIAEFGLEVGFDPATSEERLVSAE
jgi:hypothetical protein